MTALNEYDRLEASGLWRANAEDQRREVIVSLGEATLTISDLQDRVLSHWSLAATQRVQHESRAAIFHPEGDPAETLELAANETEMIAAIDRLRKVIDRRRPKPGRLRLWIGLGLAGAVALVGGLWLPDALVAHATRVVPDVKRAELAHRLLDELTRVSGPPCRNKSARNALAALSLRLTGDDTRLIVVPGGIVDAAHLPDGTILLNRTLVEDWEEPEVPAGFVLAEMLRIDEHDPLEALLTQAGTPTTVQLLTTGRIRPAALQRYAEHLLTNTGQPVAPDAILAAFAAAEVPSTPYAYALDVTGETSLPLIEADPMTGQTPRPVLRDADWVRLQGICGG